ncbi:hypothetical protein [Streptomyces erythrochromogenes]|uniref:hypothetical protein n=1 Tax=Streptomyces erythrochromogenes TaxID=285574 RepID=UPI003803CF14
MGKVFQTFFWQVIAAVLVVTVSASPTRVRSSSSAKDSPYTVLTVLSGSGTAP